MCNCSCRMLSIFNHLRNWAFFTFRNIEDVVADNVHIIMINGLQFIVTHDTFTSVLLYIQVTNKVRTFNTSCPYNSSSLQFTFVAEQYGIFCNASDLRACDHLNVHLVQVFLRFLDQLVWQDRQDLRSHICYNKTHIRWIDVEFVAKLLTVFCHFTNQLNASKASTNDNECQHLLAKLCICFFGCFIKHITDLTLQLNCIVIGPQCHRVLFSTWDTEESWLTSSTDYEVVVIVGFRLTFQLLTVKINVRDLIQDNIYFATSKDLFQVHFDSFFFDAASRYFVKLCHHRMVWMAIDQLNRNVIVLLKTLRQLLRC